MEPGIKIVFIYHVLYGSLLVRCHRVVNKGSRLRRSSCCSHTLRPVFAHSSRPVFGIRCPCVRAFIAHTFKSVLVGRNKVWQSYIHDMGGSQAILLQRMILKVDRTHVAKGEENPVVLRCTRSRISC